MTNIRLVLALTSIAVSLGRADAFKCGVQHYLSKGGTCIACDTHCASCLRQDFCEVCKETWYGPTCSESCNGCIDNKCTKTGCVIGCKETFTPTFYKYYNASFGSRCMQCNEHSIHCLTCSTDNCLRCSLRKWGKDCSKECKQTCEDLTCSIDRGVCDYGCQDRHYRDEHGYCTRCPNTCTRCNAPFNCSSCIEGRYGPQCNMACNSTIPGCHTCSSIDNQHVVCSQCHNGFHLVGSHGNCTKCSENCVKLSGIVPCNGINGFCSSGCKPGSWGDDCRNKCSSSCLDGLCDNVTGDCIACDTEHFGSQCHKECGTDCVDLDDTATNCSGCANVRETNESRNTGIAGPDPEPETRKPPTVSNEVGKGVLSVLTLPPLFLVICIIMCVMRFK